MEAVMMGKRVMAEPVFSTVRIDDYLPANHLLRAVDALLDTAFVRHILAPHYSLIGRPSIDPELMIRMLLVGYLGGIRSERKLCAGMHLNLAHRWFCRRGSESAFFGLQHETRGNCRPVRVGFRLERGWLREAVSLPGSSSPGLKRSQAQQGEPVRMALAGHQLSRAFAMAFGTPG